MVFISRSSPDVTKSAARSAERGKDTDLIGTGIGGRVVRPGKSTWARICPFIYTQIALQKTLSKM